MQSRLFLLLGFVFVFMHGYGQSLLWAKKAGGAQNDNGNKSVVDKFGNLYFTGSFQGSNVDFDPGPSTYFLSSSGLQDGFVAKYNANGNFVWAFKIGGSSQDEVGDISLDSSGNLVITGYFRGSAVDFDPSAYTKLLNSNGESGSDPGYGGDMFVAKYDTAGNYKWAFNVGGSDLGDNGVGICTDKNDDILVTGYFRTVVDFDPSAANFFLDQNKGTLFVVKYSSIGLFQWAFNAGQGGNVDNTGFAVAADNLNNVIVTGFFQGASVDFDPSPSVSTLSSSGFFDFFVAKYSGSGQFLWARSAGGTGADVGRDITVDDSNNIFITGDYNSATINFNNTLPANTVINNGGNDLFLVKYSATGAHLWSFGTGGAGSEFGMGIHRDYQDNILITGAFTGSNTDFDPSSNVISLSSQGGNDIYAVKYSSAGNYLCSFRVGGASNDIGKAITSFGNFTYLTGVFNGSNIDFDPTLNTSLLSSSGDDAFFAKYDWTVIPPSGVLSGSSNCATGISQLTFTAASGAGPFTLYINNGSTTVTYTNIQSGVPFTLSPAPVGATTYTLTGIKDANLCSALTPANSSVVLNPGSFAITTSGNASICKLDSVQLSASGGVTYQWVPSIGLNNPGVANPKASPATTTVYKVIVTNSTGCKDSALITVIVKPSPQISIFPQNATICNGDSAQLSASGGSSYQWSPAIGLSNTAIANPKASPPSTTTYKLVVVNTDGCKDSVLKTVTKSPSPIATVSPSSAICPGDSVQLLATGGSTYQWLPGVGLDNPASATPKASPDTSTVYKVIVTNAEGCKDSATTGVVLKPKPVITLGAVSPICRGDSLQLVASGGVNYQWFPSSGLSNALISNPKASPQLTTVYKVIAVGPNACLDSASTTVFVNQPPQATVNADAAICPGDSVQLNAGGGSTYLWSPSTGLSTAILSNPKASPAFTTTYKVLVYSNANCVDSAFVTVSIKAKPQVQALPSASICSGDTTKLAAAGGVLYFWTPATGLSDPSIANPFAWPVVSTNYTVVVTNSDGCKDSAKTVVSVKSKPKPNLGKDTVICQNESLFLDGTVFSASSYLWNTGESSPGILVNTPGTYTLTVFVTGCSSPTGDTIKISNLSAPTVSLGNDTIICSATSLQLIALGSNATQYFWNTGATGSVLVVSNAGTYAVTASNKCGNAVDAIVVGVDVCSDDLYFPSAFTPNGDRKKRFVQSRLRTGI